MAREINANSEYFLVLASGMRFLLLLFFLLPAATPHQVMPLASLQVAAPNPGIAGQWNTVTASGALPGDLITFAYGFSVGGTTPVPGCTGLELDFDFAQILGSVVADASGVATAQRFVPIHYSGTTVYLQAVSRSQCQKSNRERHDF